VSPVPPSLFEIAVFTPASASAYPPLTDIPIFTGFARAVVEGVAPGRLWMDGDAAHALHDYGMSLVWGEGLGRAFPALVDHLREGAYRTRDEWLQIDPRWTHLEWDRALGDRAQRFTRVNFRFDEAMFRARHAAPVLPPGWTLQPMGEAEFDLPTVSVSPRPFWKSLADFRDHGGGICAVRNGEVGAIAFSATRFDDWLEIGIETLASFRGQGLARAVAVAMIENCLANGLTPVWACRKENAGSLVLAQNLGFRITKELPYYRLPAGAAHQ
jgi:RimJ/RimL family protein N-acetyltransferase